MRSTTTISLAFSALLLSVAASPVEKRAAGTLSCPKDPAFEEAANNRPGGQFIGSLQQWCTSPATSITCGPNGKKVYGEGAVKDPACDKCTCSNAPPPPSPPPPAVAATPAALSCPKDTAFEAAANSAPGGQRIGSLQDWCTSAATSITCGISGEKIYGEGAVRDPACDKCTCPVSAAAPPPGPGAAPAVAAPADNSRPKKCPGPMCHPQDM